jgi:hypothetical protein
VANHWYVVQVAGRYEVCGGIAWTAAAVAGPSNELAAFSKNGVVGGGGSQAIIALAYGLTFAGTTLAGSTTVPCRISSYALNDTIEMDANLSGTTTVIQNSAGYTTMSIRYIGP